MYIFKLIRQFKAATGRSPTPNELSKLKQQVEAIVEQEKIIQFPNKMEFPPKKSLKEFKASEDAFESSKLRGNETFDELIDPTRIKGGISTKIKLNSFRENEQYAKDLIGGKSSEFNILKGDDRKEILDLLDEEITKGKTPPTSTDDMPFAGGGLAYMLGGGGLAGAPPVTYDDNIDNIGPGPTMPPNTMMNTPAIDPKMFNQGTGTGVMIDPRGLQQGKLQIPTQGLADGGRIGYAEGTEKPLEPINIGIGTFNPQRVVDLYEKAKNIPKNISLEDISLEDIKGIPKRLMEGTKSSISSMVEPLGNEYRAYMEFFSLPKKDKKKMEEMGLGIFDVFEYLAMRDNKAQGGRIGFKNGGMDRRGFLKLMGGLAALPIVGKFFKGAKVASKIPALKNTTTTMPTWFPDLVDKVIAKGVGKKIDADIMQYEVKELPGIQVTKHDDGRVFVEGRNDYGKGYDIEYQPPGYEVVDYKSGKAVKTKGDFTASEEVPVNMDPDGNIDFEGEILEEVGDILTSDGRVMEEFATGKKLKTSTRGEYRVGQAENAAENAADEAAERMAEEADEFASGGIAKLLGE